MILSNNLLRLFLHLNNNGFDPESDYYREIINFAGVAQGDSLSVAKIKLINEINNTDENLIIETLNENGSSEVIELVSNLTSYEVSQVYVFFESGRILNNNKKWLEPLKDQVMTEDEFNAKMHAKIEKNRNSCECRKKNTDRCRNQKKPGSRFCGIHKNCKTPL